VNVLFFCGNRPRDSLFVGTCVGYAGAAPAGCGSAGLCETGNRFFKVDYAKGLGFFKVHYANRLSQFFNITMRMGVSTLCQP
jgi:hypothetical protein